MKEKRKAPLTVFLILSFIVLSCGFYFSGALPSSVTNIINGVVYAINSRNNPASHPANSISDLSYVADEGEGMPKNVNAVWLDIDSDVSAGVSYGEMCQEASAYFDNFMNYITSVIYIRPDYDGKFNDFTDAYRNKVDVLREYISCADKYGYFKILVADGGAVYCNGEGRFDTVEYYLSNYSFDAVLLTNTGISSDSDFLEAAGYLGNKLKNEAGKPVLFGAEVPLLTSSSEYASGNTQAVLSLDTLDFVLIGANAMESPVLPFGSVMDYWNKLAKNYPDLVFYCKHRNDLVCSNNSDWSSYTEISSQVRYLWDCESFSGSVFYRAYFLKRNYRSSSQRLSYLMFDGAYTDLEITKIDVDEENAKVTFSGVAAQGHKVILNGEVISVNPTFTYKADLSAGVNEFNFFSCGKTLSYNVYNNSRIIYAVMPQEDFSVDSEQIFSIAAVCIDGAKPLCTLNGNTYDMAKTDASSFENIPEGYNIYACSVRVKGKADEDIQLGSAVITAALGEGTTEKAVTGRITVLRSGGGSFFSSLKRLFFSSDAQPDIPDVITSVDGKISPYRDNGLGTALMCKIINDDTETLGQVDEKNTYHADYSDLPAGTIDYIKDMSVSEAGYIRYELQSGMTVYGVNCEIINNGYVLPMNSIAVSRVDDSNVSSTDVYFNTDWFVPVTVKCKPQLYSSGYGGYSFNVASFTAEYVELKFYYTDTFYNSSFLEFAENSPFSHAELYSAGEESMILRLYLRQKGQFYGYDIFMDENEQLVLSFKKHINGELTGKTVMIDPGHGGLSMTGTSVNDNSVAEEEVTLSIALKAKTMLENLGAEVILTRESDIPLTLSERWDMIRLRNPDIFLSIHCDGTESRADSGTHSFYFRPYSMPLADSVNKALANVYKTHIYTPEDDNYKRVDKSIKFYPFYVTRVNQCPSILVETGFMTNEVEGQLLILDNTQYWLALGITEGIRDYFASNY